MNSNLKETDNPFAIVLYFYYLNQRSKLNESDLGKIVAKYEKKPAFLIRDLNKKYENSIPTSVSRLELNKIRSLFNIPQSYSKLLPVIIDSEQYYPKADISSKEFDPEFAIRTRYLIAPKLNIKAYDNLSKVKHLLPGSTTRVLPVFESLQSTEAKKDIADNKFIHPFTTITEIAIKPRDETNPPINITSAVNSPLALLQKFLLEKTRVRILIRRNTCVRGSIDGYIKAFDKHFNMILFDVDEEYITNKQPKRKITLGRFTNQKDVLSRHLPQLLLRGDLVVWVSAKPF